MSRLYPSGRSRKDEKQKFLIQEPTVAESKVTHIFNTNIYGNVANLASGSGNRQHANITVTTGNLTSLTEYLKTKGVPDDDIRNLENAIDNDPKPKTKIGGSVLNWIEKMAAKAAPGVWEFSKDAARDMLTAAVLAYYGISGK